MSKFELLTKLEEMLKFSLLISVSEQEVEQQLHELRSIFEKELHAEVFRFITDQDTGYYAPEHKTWKEFLSFSMGCKDFDIALSDYTEKELEELWSSSHIEEEMSNEQIKEEIFFQLCNMRTLDLCEKLPNHHVVDVRRNIHIRELIMARLQGLYSLIYES